MLRAAPAKKVENYYQVGGSLRYDRSSYVIRKADRELIEFLKAGEYCFVLNSRQMGKSSLRVRTGKKLNSEAIKCAFLDLTLIGSHVSQEKWYKGIASQLIDSLELEIEINFNLWWQKFNNFTEVQRLNELIKTILLRQPRKKIVVFIDEIDSLIKIPFKDDFFAFIRACYNQRADNPEYNRLSFCLLGVASPTDLIQDKGRTPFNIGRSIELTGLTFAEAKDALIPGLAKEFNDPEEILKQILYWTGGQPFLTQKLCSLIVQKANNQTPDVSAIVEQYIIQNWESQDEPEHLRTIRDRILINEKRAIRLLGFYQQILDNKTGILADETNEQTELRLSGLVVKKDGCLQAYNPIYKQVFNRDWIGNCLDNLRPYSEAINDWIKSNRNDVYLLTGKALENALAWAEDKNLSDVDYQFLATSRAEQDRKANQILAQANQKAKQTIRRGGIVLGITSIVSILIAVGTTLYTQQQLKKTQETFRLEKAGINALEQFNFNQLDSLLLAMQAVQDWQKLVADELSFTKTSTVSPLNAILNILSQIDEQNLLEGHQKLVRTVAFSPDGEIIASGSDDGTLKLWKQNGTLIKTLIHGGTVFSVAFSPDGEIIASSSDDETVKLWKRDGTLLKTIAQGNWNWTYSLNFSPDGQTIAAGGNDGKIKLWKRDGTLLKTLSGHRGSVYSVNFSPDGKTIASGDNKGQINFWKRDGTLLKTLTAHTGKDRFGVGVNSIAFSPDGVAIASGGEDNTIRLWKPDGTTDSRIQNREGSIWSIAFSPDGQTLASSVDNTIVLWHLDGRPSETFTGHGIRVYGLSFSPDGSVIASGNSNGTVQIWRRNEKAIAPFRADDERVTSISFSPDGKEFATAGWDKTIKLWQFSRSPSKEATMTKTLAANRGLVNSISFSADGKILVAGHDDGTIALWDNQGKLQKLFAGHSGQVTSVKFSTDGKVFASGGGEGKIQLWDIQGNLLQTFLVHNSEVSSIDISPDGKTLVSGSRDGKINLWKSDGTLMQTLFGHVNGVTSVAFSPDGNKFVSGGDDGTVKLWRREGTLIFALQAFGRNSNVKSLRFSPDGVAIAAGYDDGTVKLWRSDGTLMLDLAGNSGDVTSIDISPDGQTLIAGSGNGTVSIWNFNLNSLLVRGCSWLNDYLTVRPTVRQTLTACQNSESR